jgi:glutamyl-tRNA reductase
MVIEYGVLQFERWRARLRAKPEIVDLRGRVSAICEVEVRKALGAFAMQHPEVSTRLGHSISEKISHELVDLMHGRGTAEDDYYPLLMMPTDKGSRS